MVVQPARVCPSTRRNVSPNVVHLKYLSGKLRVDMGRRAIVLKVAATGERAPMVTEQMPAQILLHWRS